MKETTRVAKPAPQAAHPAAQKPADRFIASMTITFDMWHDGTGYDLDALRAVPPGERARIEHILISHQPRDWRDVEALAQIDSPHARMAIEEALNHRDPKVRREAAKYAGDKIDPAEREALLLKSLKTCRPFDGLTEALDEVEKCHPPSVIDAMLRGLLDREGDIAVHFAAMLLFLHGKAKEPFDWDHRPFFLRFNTEDRAERKAVFRELCETIGTDATRYLRS